ncbi:MULTISPECIES: LysR family transcriptional regulator [Tenacibaculum]|uniref:LysR family transcriptional regulator n=1 Tax=Tenacibaculum aiptasiae TaxID=426481 RepID=A0A7J5ACP9_9FLAO|nr:MULTISPECIES: LysR family transcriptional regulator [Tenacibaculum]KAB1155334.1 LysR family transcriptional regulator [Tenacibaculum aiptasiae]MCF2873427.1 LysR family transcriptional regulator [Tenacibaculum sp. Cn5-1]MCF2933583.1 LysR family transcriptional regulator [Tenacibaculum sp. Cn5-34]MCG7509835.1 LysR family transcriptional regulator [Tenacibaculum sp. Cn5-46]
MSYQIELRHFRYFLAVAEDLHFRKAAERLFISQPGLSRQIKQMEDDLGVELFVRHNRKVELTSAGLYLKNELTRNLKNLDNILDYAKLLQDGKQGKLEFGYVGSAMQDIIPNLLIQFKKEHPNVQFGLKEMDNQKQIESLLSHDIDVGFVRLDRVPRGLNIKPILKESFCLVLPKNHPINTSNFKGLQELKDESFILFDPSYSPSYYEKIMQIFDESGFTPIVSHNTIHAASIYKLVENNFGLSIVPKSLQKGYNMNVKFIELHKIPQRTTLSVVWDKNNRNPIVASLIEKITT